MSQTSLFEQAHARASDPETSHVAAARASKGLTQTKERILALLTIKGPMDDEALVEEFSDYYPGTATPQSIRSRRAELVRAGKVRFTGDYSVTHTGGKSRIWEAAR